MCAQSNDYPEFKPTDDARFVDGGRRCVAWSTTNGRRCIAPCAPGLDVCLVHNKKARQASKQQVDKESVIQIHGED